MSTAFQHLFNKTDVVEGGVYEEKTLAPLTLLRADIHVSVVQYCARIRVTFTYRNDLSSAANVIFVFPVEDEWTISGFQAQLAGRIVTGGIKQRPHLHKEFREGALAASLADKVNPGESVVTHVWFLTALEDHTTLNSPELSLVIPPTLLPKPVEQERTDWQKSFTLAQQKAMNKVLCISVECTMDELIDSAASANHKMLLKRDGTSASGVFEKEFGPNDCITLDTEFRLQLILKAAVDVMKVAVVKEIQPTDDAFTYALSIPIVPNVAKENNIVNTEVFFVVDCSGSMQGYTEVVERTVKLCLQGLPSTAKFNVVLFGDSVLMFDEAGAQQYTQDNLLWARAFVHHLKADMGGTDLYQALKAVYNSPITRGYCRQVFVISDSPVNKPCELMPMVMHASNYTRLFLFSTNPHPADKPALKTLANLSRGRTIFFDKGNVNTLTERMLNLLHDALQPALTNVTVTYKYENSGFNHFSQVESQEPPIQNTVPTLPLLFSGSKYVLYAFASDKMGHHPVVTLSAWIGDKHMSWNYHITDLTNARISNSEAGTPDDISVTHAFAAIERIRALTEFNTKSAITAQEKVEVVRLSCSFGIISPYTGYHTTTTYQNAGRRIPNGETDADRNEVALEYSYVLPRHERNTAKIDKVRPDVIVQRKSLKQEKDPDDIVLAKPKKQTTFEFCGDIVKYLIDLMCRSPTIDNVIFAQSALGNWEMGSAFSRAIDVPFHLLITSMPNIGEDTVVVVPSIIERDRQLEEDTRKAEELVAQQKREEHEKAIKRAEFQHKKQKRLREERMKLGDEDANAAEEQERRRAEEEAAKAQKAREREEKERREREKEAEKEKKKREAERRKLVKKLGEDAVRAQQQAELKRQQEEEERKRKEEEAAIKRQEDMRLMWEKQERTKYLQNIWATAIALAYLQLEYAAKQYEYHLAVQRALHWLQETQLVAVIDWPQQAAAFLRPILNHRHHLLQIESAAKAEAKERAQREIRDKIAAEEAARRQAEEEKQNQLEAEQRALREEQAAQDVYSSEEETVDSRRTALQQQREEELAAQQVDEEVEEEPAIVEEGADEEQEEDAAEVDEHIEGEEGDEGEGEGDEGEVDEEEEHDDGSGEEEEE